MQNGNNVSCRHVVSWYQAAESRRHGVILPYIHAHEVQPNICRFEHQREEYQQVSTTNTQRYKFAMPVRVVARDVSAGRAHGQRTARSRRQVAATASQHTFALATHVSAVSAISCRPRCSRLEEPLV